VATDESREAEPVSTHSDNARPYGWWRGLIEQVGPAFYVAHPDRFAQNLRDFQAALAHWYPRTRLGYSYKTNYLPYFCALADECGAYAEVVSRLELDMALRLGIPGERIIFNGPAKELPDLRHAFDHGVLVNLDSTQEVAYVEQLAADGGRDFRVGVRCNFPLRPDHRSRFGFDATTSELAEACRRLRAVPGCRVLGLHCHFSHHRDADSYRVRAEWMVRLAKQLFGDSSLDFLDLGGGFCGRMPPALASQFANPIPTYEDYAAAIGPVLADGLGRDSSTELIVEPGMGVVADAMDFVAEVSATKTIRGKPYAVTAGSIYNIKPTLNRMNLPVTVIANPQSIPRVGSAEHPVDLVGYTCMEIDTMYEGWPGSLGRSDVVVFHNVGAYTIVLLPPFIRSAPPIVAISADGQVQELARGQTIDDVLAMQRDLPDLLPANRPPRRRSTKETTT